MAIIKSITNEANQTAEYHKILLEYSNFLLIEGVVNIRLTVASYKNKATRESVDPAYTPTSTAWFQLATDDLRAECPDFAGLYALLKTHETFVGATDDI